MKNVLIVALITVSGVSAVEMFSVTAKTAKDEIDVVISGKPEKTMVEIPEAGETKGKLLVQAEADGRTKGITVPLPLPPQRWSVSVKGVLLGVAKATDKTVLTTDGQAFACKEPHRLKPGDILRGSIRITSDGDWNFTDEKKTIWQRIRN